ncbi:MAG TPA: tetratricopeptide repeat protein [bacterium]|jgi:tetratricopeptide (TPR) repeat protein|nr:tetratricopeptide repeat protein [bacterium]
MPQHNFFLIMAILGVPLFVSAQDMTPTEKTSTEPNPAAVASADFKTFKEGYAAGNQALKDHRLDEAAADYGAAETLASSDQGKSQAANAQGWAYWKAKKLEEAKKAFERAVEENGDNKVALKNLGVVSYRMYEYGLSDVSALKDSVKNLEASGDDQELLDRANGDLSREEGYAQVTPEPKRDISQMRFKELCSYGDKLQSDGQFEAAMKAFKQAALVAVSPDAKGTAANRQGKLLLDSHHPGEAVADFEEAVGYKPSDKELKVFLNSLGLSYWSVYDSGKGKGDELKKSVDAFYKMNSIDASYHHENLEMALDELKEVDPDAAKAYTVKDDSSKDDSTLDNDKAGDAKDDKSKDDEGDSGASK